MAGSARAGYADLMGEPGSTLSDLCEDLQPVSYFLKSFVVVVTVAVSLVIASYWFSLDRDFNHTKATNKLPHYDSFQTADLIQIRANDLTFRARVAGFGKDSERKPLVILLHGFPSTSVSWIELIPILEAAGYRVLAFDQRGYSPGARPEGVESYLPEKRVDDIVAIADVVGAGKFHLIGHDFGALTGWLTVLTYPDRILSWTGLSSPHPGALIDAFDHDHEQRRRSWYAMAFQIPWLPEVAFGTLNAGLLWYGYDKSPGNKASEIREVFAEPGAMTAALNWYRVFRLIQADQRRLLNPDITRPTLFIWGNQDFSVSRWTIERQEAYIQAPYRVVELNAGHWIVNDELYAVSEEILQHLSHFE